MPNRANKKSGYQTCGLDRVMDVEVWAGMNLQMAAF